MVWHVMCSGMEWSQIVGIKNKVARRLILYMKAITAQARCTV